MIRNSLLCTAALLTTLSVSTAAHADTKPAVVWIPTASVDVTPSGAFGTQCEKSSMSGSAVAAGCLANLDEATTLTPHPDAQQIADGIAAAFAAYDVHVVTEAPPEYLPTYAIFTSSEAVKDGTSYTCSTSTSNCSALGRDRAYFTNGGTNFCTDPDALASAAFALGLMSGLEGKDNAPDDWMNYPPDFLAPPTQFLDVCGDIAFPLGGDDGVTPLPLQCTSLDHTGCGSQEQNSHADLLENLGPLAADGDAPVIEVMSPADGDVIAEGGSLLVTLALEEASNYAGVRVTMGSDALVGIQGILGGEISFCTNDLCDVNWLDGEPFKTADSGWTTGDISGLPGGEYTIEIEASDYYGNEADTITLVVTLAGGPVDPTTGGDTDGGDTSTGGGDETTGGGASTDPSASTTSPSGGDTGTSGPVTSAGGSGDVTTNSGTGSPDPTAADGSGSESSGEPGADDTVGGGCSTGDRHGTGSSIALMLGLLGLGLRRRR